MMEMRNKHQMSEQMTLFPPKQRELCEFVNISQVPVTCLCTYSFFNDLCQESKAPF